MIYKESVLKQLFFIKVIPSFQFVLFQSFDTFNISLQEKAMALKIGRQKKIQIIDGQQVEVLTGDDEDDEVKKCTLHNFSFWEKSIRFFSQFCSFLWIGEILNTNTKY
jgi:hypothetical protein